MTDLSDEIGKRKKDHLKIALSGDSQVGNPGFSGYRFVHNALPEIDFDEIDTKTVFLGKKVNYPFFISCMTGGVADGEKINKNLATAAQKYNIPMGVGSQRIAVENPDLKRIFSVRKFAPDIPVMANIGLVQLNYGVGLKELKEAIKMVEADALVFHINPIQEAIQPEGDRNFKNLVFKLKNVIKKLSVPVIVKEVGFGLSEEVVARLYDAGVKIFDTAGWGGTNWALVEGLRGKADKNLGQLFANWGIPTAESIKMCYEFKSKISSVAGHSPMTILGSGGVRSGVDIAKALALGADLAGIAAPFAKAALESEQAIHKLIERYIKELKIAMFGVGAKNIDSLKKSPLVKI